MSLSQATLVFVVLAPGCRLWHIGVTVAAWLGSQ